MRFRYHMQQVLGATLGLTVGCGGSAREQRMRKDLTDDFCIEGEAQLIQGLKPTEAVDALALRSFYYQFPNNVDELSEADRQLLMEDVAQSAEVGMSVRETAGSCDSIVDCPKLPLPERNSELADKSGDTYEPLHLVAYRGDQAEIYYTEAEVRAFLGTIDTPEEAQLLLRLKRHRLPCDGDNNYQIDGTDYVFYTETGSTCGDNVTGHLTRVTAEGELEEEESGVVERGDKGCVIGRLPAGLCAAQSEGANNELIEHMARQAYLEAASVAAFEDLEMELRSYGAPLELSAWAKRASDQERRHALHCRALTRKFGGEAQVPARERAAMRSPLQVACDNAREGLTREAFGALLAHHQALFARDLDVRVIMQEIAADELSHAEFSWALHHYLMQLLSVEERALVEKVRISAIDEFRASLTQECSAALRAQLGLPDQTTSERLFSGLFDHHARFEA